MVKYEKYETKSGKTKWKYYAHYGVDEKTGKKIKIRGQGFNSKNEAKIAFERKYYSFNEKEESHKRHKFEEVYIEFLEYYYSSGIKPGTYKKLKDDMDNYVLPDLKDWYIDKIEIDDCQKLYDKIRIKRKDHRKIKNQVKRIFDFAISKKYIDSNPMQYVLVSKVNTRYRKRRLSSSENFYTPEQLIAFLQAFKEVEEYHKFVYFRLLAFTGLRRGEALALKVHDINLDKKSININKTITEDEFGRTIISESPKTENSSDVVYLDNETFECLKKLLKNRTSLDDFVFKSPRTGKNYHKAAPNDWLLRFFDRNEIELKKRNLHRISPHGFRHSQATLLYELGVNPKDAQNRLRHKNIKTTMDIYTHLSEKQKQTPISKLEQFSSKGTILGTTEQNNEKIK